MGRTETLGNSLGLCWDDERMRKKLICLFGIVSAIGAGALFAQEKTTWTLNLSKKSYTLKQALAYETTIDNEEATAVVLSGAAISSEELKEAREREKGGSDPLFPRPFLRLVFKPSGELKHWSAAAGGTTMG